MSDEDENSDNKQQSNYQPTTTFGPKLFNHKLIFNQLYMILLRQQKNERWDRKKWMSEWMSEWVSEWGIG
jgi:hypothetical protein